MPRLTVFAKGNVDVRDALHSAVVNGVVRWNGINELVRTRFPGWTVRVRHEIWNRSDALLATDGTVPPELAARDRLQGAFPAAAQCSRAVFETASDVVVLSVQPDAMTPLVRHRRDGYLFYPYGTKQWPAADLQWMLTECDLLGHLSPAASVVQLIEVINRIYATSGARVLIFNLSSVVPGDTLHLHDPEGEALSTRLRRFNLVAIEAAAATGASVIDVDAVIARAGADRLKVDANHLHPEGSRLVAEEVVRVLAELGCFEAGA